MFGKLFGKSQTHKFNYKEPDIGSKIISEYGGELMVACVTGMSGIGQVEKLNEFCSHMAAAALQGDSFGIALSCFSQHGEPFNQYLPVPIRSMPEEGFVIFVELLKNNIDFGFSKSAKRYLSISRDEVEEKANEENPYALWLMGAWYAFDDFETKGQDSCMKKRLYWYEKSAFEGYLPAIKAIAGLYDNGDDTENLSLPTDLKKSAFWYRHGALEGDPMCAYNLGVMYLQGDFVEKNRDVAKMWLSLSYKNNDDPSFASHIQRFAKQFDIQLTNTPNLNLDPELNNTTSEFQDAYEDNSNSNSGNKFWEWVQNNCMSVKFKPQEIETWSDLKELELRSNDLTDLSDGISILTGLVDLSLFHNNFSIVPKVIFNLTELTWLNFGVNQIAELPHGIGRLKKLKILNLGQNQLISLPREIGDLTNLEQLILHNNNLTSLPKEIGKMFALKHISIWDNDLSSLPEEIMGLNNLETIELQNNNFTNEDVKKWTDRFSGTKCKITFGYQKGNISDPIYVEKNIKGGSLEDSFSELYLNSKDGDTVSNIFHWSSSDADDDDFLSIYMANKKYSKICINKGLNAINSENSIVPINMELNAETPSAEDELIGWVKIIYIETCNERNLKPNPKLRIASVGSKCGSFKIILNIEEGIKNLIETKANEMNPNALYCCNSVSIIINQLNNYIDGRINLNEERIAYLLDHLVGYYTITLDIPLDSGLKILRAVKFDNLEEKPCFRKVSRLSYIPENSKIIPSIGRLNKDGKSIFYGCIYFNDNFGGYNVAFSEIDALKNEKINILKSEITSEIKVNYVGIYDYVKRESKPYFLSEEVYLYFKAVYEYEEKMFDKYVFVAFQLCDAFFSDILRRKESDRLYIVTSILASHFLDGDRVDGLIYTSVKAEGSPVIAINPSSVDSKISHKEAVSFEIQENYGYAMYKANPLYQGVVNGEIINWN